MNKKIKFFKWFMLSIILISGMVLIPTCTILFALKDNIIESTLSKIGNELGYKTELILFCSALALFFIVSATYIFTLTKMKDKVVFTFLVTTSIVLVLTAFTPFLPSTYPFLAQVHNGFGVSSVCCAIMTFILYAKTIKDLNKRVYKRAIIGSVFIFIVSMFTFIAVGMSSLIEVIFIYISCFFIGLHLIDLYLCKDVNIDKSIEDGMNYFKNRKKIKLHKKNKIDI